MSDTYGFSGNSFSLIRELGGFRVPNAVKDTAPTRTLPTDTIEEGAISILRSILKKERKRVLGTGRKLNRTSYLGRDPVEESLNFYLETGMFMAKALGSTITTGTSYGTPKTGTISAGQGTAVLTITGITLVAGAHAGDLLKVAYGPGFRSFAIVTNGTADITIDLNSPADINTKTFEIMTAPFLHVSTLGSTLKSHAVAYTFPNTDSNESIYSILLGIYLKSVEWSIEKDAEAMQSVGFLGAKNIHPVSYTPPTPWKKKGFHWCHATTFTFDYNGEACITKEICDSIKLSVENEIDLDKTLGDCNAQLPKFGTVDPTLTLHYYPKSRTLYDLIDQELENYLDDITLTVKMQDPATADRYIEIIFNKLELVEHPAEIPSPDDKIWGVDAVFNLTEEDDSTITINEKNELGIEYYEGSYGGL